MPNSVMSHAAITDNPIIAATAAKAGKLIIYPTESVWGIGCDPFNKSAVQKLLGIKNRPIDKGMIVITDSVARIEPLLAAIDPTTRQHITDSWQAPLNDHQRQAHTWLLPIPKTLPVPIPDWITGAHNSVAVRVINHPLIKKLCAQMASAANPYGFIVSTSCNPSGKPPAITLVQALRYFDSPTHDDTMFLTGDTLGYELPSQIHDAKTGNIIR